MAQPAQQLHGRTAWHNPLPGWIYRHPSYESIPLTYQRTLQAIADRCTVQQDGSLVGAFGGRALLTQSGCSRAAFWRQLDRLITLGFVVQMGRGGTIGSRQYANQYGIPGAPGALDTRRCRRRMQRMVRDRDDGKLRPEVIEPGEQPSLWPRQHPPGETGGSLSETRVRRGGGSLTVRHLQGSPSGSDPKNQSGSDGVSRRRRSSPSQPHRPTMRDIQSRDLAHTGRLLELYADAVERGLITSAEADRLRFVAAAEHARRVADNPPALFAATVRHQRWLFVAQDDEDAAVRRLREHDSPEEPSVPQSSTAGQASPTLSSDATLAHGVYQAARQHGGTPEQAFAAIRDHYGWDRARWDRALCEAGVRP